MNFGLTNLSFPRRRESMRHSRSGMRMGFFLSIIFLLLPLSVHAATYKDLFLGGGASCSPKCPAGQICDTASNKCVSTSTDFFGIFGVTQGGSGIDAANYGPLRFWSNAINALLGLLGIFSVAAILYGGIKFMTSEGEADKAKSASKTVLYAALGLVTIALAWVIAYVLINSIAKIF